MTQFRAEEMTARVGAEKALRALKNAPREDRARAQELWESASEAYERARTENRRAQMVASPDAGGLEVRNGASLRTGYEQPTYYAGGPHSWFQDQWAAREDKGKPGDQKALERIVRNARELAATRGTVTLSASVTARGGRLTFDQERAISGEGSKGEALLPPQYLQDELTRAARVGRPYVNNIRKAVIPAHGAVIDIPKLKSGGAAEPQKNLGEVVDTDLSTEESECPVTQIVGREDMARQLFERAVPDILDGVLMPDLSEAYAGSCDVQAISGNGTLPNLTGIENLANVNAAEWTGETIAAFVKAISYCRWVTQTKRYLPATHLFVHPTVWAWVEGLEDTAKRPLLLPKELTPADYAALREYSDEDLCAGMPVAKWGNLLVVLDSNLPTKLTAGKNKFGAIVQRAGEQGDAVWWEFPSPLTRVYQDTELSKELAVRIEVFSYVAVTQRYPNAINFLTCPAIAEPTV